MSKEEYLRNCERVYEIYGIPKRDRGGRYTVHHLLMKSDYKYGLIPNDGKQDVVENLCPLKSDDHHNLHRKLEWIGEDWNGGIKIRRKH